MSYQYQGKSGGYKLTIEQGIAMSQFNGICSDAVAKRYLLDITHLAKTQKGNPWAHIADAAELLAAIPGAEPHLLKAYSVSKAHFCISDAYCLSSPVAIAQLDKLRRQSQLPDKIEERIFTHSAHAVTFLKHELKKFIALRA